MEEVERSGMDRRREGVVSENLKRVSWLRSLTTFKKLLISTELVNKIRLKMLRCASLPTLVARRNIRIAACSR